MNSSERVELVRRYCAGWSDKDRTLVEQLTAEDFHFTSPLDNRIDRATYFQRCWPNSAHMQVIDVKRALTDGDTVLITYELTMKDGRRFRNTEAITVHDGLIHDVEVYFGWDLPHKAPAGGFVERL